MVGDIFSSGLKSSEVGPNDMSFFYIDEIPFKIKKVYKSTCVYF